MQVLRHGYVSGPTSSLWGRSLVAAANARELPRRIASSYPQLPISFEAVAGLSTHLRQAATPYLLGALLGSFLLAWVYTRIRRRHGFWFAALCMLLVGLHPLFLWAATSGLQRTMVVGASLFLVASVTRMARLQDVRAFMMLSMAIPIAAFVWIGGLWFLILLALLLPLILPPEIRKASLPAGYIACFLIPLAALVCSGYISWIVGAGLSSFWWPLKELARPGLPVHGGTLLRPFLNATLMAVAAVPVSLPPFFFRGVAGVTRRALLVCLLMPPVVSALTASRVASSEPLDAAVAECGVLLVVLVWIGSPSRSRKRFIIAFLLLGLVGGYASLVYSRSEDASRWLGALRGYVQARPHSAGDELGHGLHAHYAETVIDPRGNPAIVSHRGDAEDLDLPGCPRFAEDLEKAAPSVPLGVLPNPDDPVAESDLLSAHFPGAFERGFRGHSGPFGNQVWHLCRCDACDGESQLAREQDNVRNVLADDEVVRPSPWIALGGLLLLLAIVTQFLFRSRQTSWFNLACSVLLAPHRGLPRRWSSGFNFRVCYGLFSAVPGWRNGRR